MEPLKNKPDGAAADNRLLIIAQTGDILLPEPIPAGGRRVKAAKNIHQGGFPRSPTGRQPPEFPPLLRAA